MKELITASVVRLLGTLINTGDIEKESYENIGT